MSDYPRDLIGYGANPPQADWPGGARLAVQIVMNYEEGGENSILHGDQVSETFLSEIVGARPVAGQAPYEHGAESTNTGRASAFWRLLRMFERKRDAADRLRRRHGGWSAIRRRAARWSRPVIEIASHGLRWINYQYVPEDEERAQMHQAMDIPTQVTGERPLGWYTGAHQSQHARGWWRRYGGFLYDSDDYNDDLPYCGGRAAGRS